MNQIGTSGGSGLATTMQVDYFATLLQAQMNETADKAAALTGAADSIRNMSGFRITAQSARDVCLCAESHSLSTHDCGGGRCGNQRSIARHAEWTALRRDLSLGWIP